METRWSGRVSERLGIGFELQYHPAPQGSSFEIVNDAFLEYYASEKLTIRAGQFVKPFGFDIQQSSSVREAPERGIFAGYFFPGQRDKGVMLMADLEGFHHYLRGTTLYAAILNGNRFFDDNNRNVNFNFRLRKVFSLLPLAVGASAQLGSQIMPSGIAGSAREDLFGADLQFVWKRLGIRGEFVTGNMPSTLLNLEPEYAPAFRPNAKSTGAAAFANIHITRRNDIYGRFDWFRNDPVTSGSVHAWNIGYFRTVGEHGRVGVDYQWKNRLSFNDDRLNTRLQITWNVIY
ncbi:MAG: porin [Bryobacteraceae bacterium]